MNFFGGSFFGGGFFGVTVTTDAPTPAGGVIGKRRWVLIGDKLYHANAEETAMLLDAYIAPEKELPVPEVETKPPKKKRTPPRKVAVEVPQIIPEPFRDDFVKYKRMYDDYMAQMLLEAAIRADDDDIEVLLLH